MKRNHFLTWVSGACLLGALSAPAQQQKPVSERPNFVAREGQVAEAESAATNRMPAQDNRIVVPRLVKISGALGELAQSLSSPVEVTFALYQQEADQEPVWTETQMVAFDKKGHYTVLLGATQTEGLPVELFSSGEAHWLGVAIQSQPLPTRTLLVSVPYALKAVDADKLAGRSPSDFVLSESLGEQVRQVIQAQSEAGGPTTSTATLPQGQTKTNSTLSPQITAAGPMLPPSSFSGSNSTQIVQVTQNGSGNGILGFTAGVNGFGVFGVAPNATGNATGVVGVTNSISGSGVYGQTSNGQQSGFGVLGNATATAGYTAGVGGLTASPNGAGVNGLANATSGFNSGVFGQSASSNGTGVFGTSVQWVGVGGQATATSGGPAFGVWGDSLSTGGTGVAGFEDATSGFTNGVSGQSVSPNGVGVVGVNNSSSGGIGVGAVANAASGLSWGVWAQTASNQGVAVQGSAYATSGYNAAVDGGNWSTNGSGVSGYSWATSGNTVGLLGQVNSPNGTAGLFSNIPGQGLLLQGVVGPSSTPVFTVDASGSLQISGNLTVLGSKSSIAKLHDGREVALYAVESPENWFEDFGSGELKNGTAWVPLDASFADAVNASLAYHVFLTPNGDSSGLYVARKTATGFEVREHGAGTSNLAFDYRIVARRRGFETVRMAEVHGQERQVARELLTEKQPAKTPVLSSTRITIPVPRPTIAPQQVRKISVPLSFPPKP